jgi:hypothetical protein
MAWQEAEIKINKCVLPPPPSVAAPKEIRQLVDYHQACGFDSPEELLDFIKVFWGVHIPRAKVCPEHTPPAEYITAAFFEDVLDCVCWANRGGGKTFNGALVTWLDSVFKAGCETKILGGSGEQSLRMYEHMKGFITPPFQHLIEGEALRTRTHLVNGSNVQILTASMKSIRGPHPQKLKLDEVDEFEDKIYEAALLIPKSARGIRASVQIYSTMHKAYGLMSRVVAEAAESGYRLFKWCVFDVMEKCVDRDCETCDLWEECEGRARNADGFYPVEDAITAKRRVSRETWEAEMLCRMPSQEGLIYKEFDLSVHVI